MFVPRLPAILLAASSLVLGACRSYEPRPLEPERLLLEVDRDRRAGAGEEPVDFADAATWLRERGPGPREAEAAYATALAATRHPSPLPNPGLEIGPAFGFGDTVRRSFFAPFGSLGASLPLGDRLESRDLLLRAQAERARLEGLVRHRSLYLDLRRAWARLLGARRRAALARELLGSARRGVETSIALVEAGQGTALDVALLEIELGRAEAAVIEAELDEAGARGELALLTGVREDRFLDCREDRVRPPEAVPEVEELRDLLVEEHPELIVLRAQYAEAEAALRLEIARQWPDLDLGFSGESEPGEDRQVFGLTLGIALPLFDRNEQAIATAEARREEIRIRYESSARRALAALDRSRGALALAGRRRELLKASGLRRARRGLDLARAAVSAAAGDALRLLEAERGYARASLDAEAADLALVEAWMDLEGAVGRPLFALVGEEASVAAPPAGLAAPPENEEER